ncbi:MAG: leucine-rich repeat domain-containing protein [Clostridia bacterium]|nr:leucine-rich repeat domain-containing protein [Clostridia bacterium]
MKKKAVAVILALAAFALIAVGVVYTAQKHALSETEFTHDGIVWTLKNGTALVSGEGVLDDLAEQYDYARWQYGLLNLLEKETPIKKVVLGEGITGVNDDALRRLDGLKEIEVEEGNPYLSAADGVLYDQEKTVLLYYPPAKPGAAYTVPEGVTEIGCSAFAGNGTLKRIVFPEGLEAIGENAFSDCGKLAELTFPESLQRIGDRAFEGCAALKALDLPDRLYAVGDQAFQGCAGLTAVELPAGLKKLGECAFRHCAGVTAFTVAEGNTVFSAVDGVLFRYGGRVLVQYPRGKAGEVYAVPEGVEEIGYAAFEGSALTEATFPDSLTRIGPAAFMDCAALEKVDMPDHVKAIDDAAFSGCAALKEVTLAKYLESIGIEAFFGCPALKTVTVPKKVEFVGFRSLGFTALFGSKKYTEGFLLRCTEGSRAQAYAEEYGVSYELVS